MNSRRAGPGDRAWLSKLLGAGAAGAIDQDTHRIEIVEDGTAKAAGLWVAKPDHAFLGPVMVSALTERRDLFHAAIIATAKAAVAEGYTVAKTRVKDERIVRILERTYGVTFTPVGHNVKTGKVGNWTLTVDPAEIVATARRRGMV